MTDTTGPGRDESAADRVDRNWNELLQELRVTQTGVQILFAFLLILPFQQRFSELDEFDRRLYVAVVFLITLSTVANLAPVIAHRFLFRRHRKDVLIRTSDRLGKISFLALGLALIGAVALVLDLVVGDQAAMILVAVVGLAIVGLWLVLPSVLLSRGRDTRY